MTHRKRPGASYQDAAEPKAVSKPNTPYLALPSSTRKDLFGGSPGSISFDSNFTRQSPMEPPGSRMAEPAAGAFPKRHYDKERERSCLRKQNNSR